MPTEIRYQKLLKSSGNIDGEIYSSLQFKKPKPIVPVKAILTAAALFICGTILITIGVLLITGHIDTKYRYTLNF